MAVTMLLCSSCGSSKYFEAPTVDQLERRIVEEKWRLLSRWKHLCSRCNERGC